MGDRLVLVLELADLAPGLFQLLGEPGVDLGVPFDRLFQPGQGLFQPFLSLFGARGDGKSPFVQRKPA